MEEVPPGCEAEKKQEDHTVVTIVYLLLLYAAFHPNGDSDWLTAFSFILSSQELCEVDLTEGICLALGHSAPWKKGDSKWCLSDSSLTLYTHVYFLQQPNM